MRVISGKLRGRRLQAPPGRGTRPMLDRVREALFNRLQADVPDAVVLDLFAGSGSLGIEALSRGAASARFVERGAAAARVLRANVESLGLDDVAEILSADALRPESWVATPDLVFADAPYPLLRDPATRAPLLVALRTLASETLAPGGCVVFHAPRNGVLVHDFAGIDEVEERVYGTSSLWFLERHVEATT